jgi:hypothetical protein
LIIEDAERVISDREGNGSPAGVSNILNLTDGILGDCLSIQIVATFNMKREKIDQALLRKGRLIVEHKFSKLSAEESNKLLKHLEKDHIVEESMCLADIYNIDVELIKTANKSKKATRKALYEQIKFTQIGLFETLSFLLLAVYKAFFRFLCPTVG